MFDFQHTFNWGNLSYFQTTKLNDMLLDEQMCIFLLPNGISDFQISVSTFFSWLDYFKLVKYVYLREFSVIKFNRLQILIQTQIPIQIILALPDKSCHNSKIKKALFLFLEFWKRKKSWKSYYLSREIIILFLTFLMEERINQKSRKTWSLISFLSSDS